MAKKETTFSAIILLYKIKEESLFTECDFIVLVPFSISFNFSPPGKNEQHMLSMDCCSPKIIHNVQVVKSIKSQIKTFSNLKFASMIFSYQIVTFSGQFNLFQILYYQHIDLDFPTTEENDAGWSIGGLKNLVLEVIISSLCFYILLLMFKVYNWGF